MRLYQLPKFTEVVVVEAVFERRFKAFVLNRCSTLLTEKAWAIQMFPDRTDLTTLKRIRSVHFHKLYNAMCIYMFWRESRMTASDRGR